MVVFRAGRTLVDIDESVASSLAVPWEAWDARLALGSIMKVVVDNVSNKHVRVREAARTSVLTVAQVNDTGLTLVARHLVSEEMPPTLDEKSTWRDRLEYAQFGRRVAHRMQMLQEVVTSFRFDSNAAVISLDTVLKAAACGLAHKGQLCRAASRKVVKTAYSIVSALDAQNHFATLPGRTQEYLFPLLPAARRVPAGVRAGGGVE